MKITLNPDLERFIKSKIADGEFASPDDFMNQATRIYREIDQQHAALKAELKERLAQLDRGEGTKLEGDAQLRAFFDNIKARGRERLAVRHNG